MKRPSCCQGRLKSGPLASVEKWTTLERGAAPFSVASRRRAEENGAGAVGVGSGDFGGFGADPGVEVFASEAVAVAFERQDR